MTIRERDGWYTVNCPFCNGQFSILVTAEEWLKTLRARLAEHIVPCQDWHVSNAPEPTET